MIYSELDFTVYMHIKKSFMTSFNRRRESPNVERRFTLIGRTGFSDYRGLVLMRFKRAP